MDELTISIPRASLRFGFPPYTSYEIDIQAVVDDSYTSWTSEKRYSEFLALFQTFVVKYGLIRDFPFPEKTHLKRYFTDTIEERKRVLALFLQRCLDDPDIVNDVQFRNFLNFPDRFMNMELLNHEEEEEEEESILNSPPPLALPTNESIESSKSPMESELEEEEEFGRHLTSQTQNEVSTEYNTPQIESQVIEESEDKLAIGNYSFKGDSERELSFEKGDKLVLISTKDSEWYYGYREVDRTKLGFMPSGFMTIIEHNVE